MKLSKDRKILTMKREPGCNETGGFRVDFDDFYTRSGVEYLPKKEEFMEYNAFPEEYDDGESRVEVLELV